MSETHEARVKRLYMRSIRRGIKEMDLILGGFAANHLDGLNDAQLTTYDRLLSENDHDLYAWANGAAEPLDEFKEIMALITATWDKPKN